MYFKRFFQILCITAIIAQPDILFAMKAKGMSRSSSSSSNASSKSAASSAMPKASTAANVGATIDTVDKAISLIGKVALVSGCGLCVWYVGNKIKKWAKKEDKRLASIQGTVGEIKEEQEIQGKTLKEVQADVRHARKDIASARTALSAKIDNNGKAIKDLDERRSRDHAETKQTLENLAKDNTVAHAETKQAIEETKKRNELLHAERQREAKANQDVLAMHGRELASVKKHILSLKRKVAMGIDMAGRCQDQLHLLASALTGIQQKEEGRWRTVELLAVDVHNFGKNIEKVGADVTRIDRNLATMVAFAQRKFGISGNILPIHRPDAPSASEFIVGALGYENLPVKEANPASL